MHPSTDSVSYSHLMHEILQHVKEDWSRSSSFSVLSLIGLRLSNLARQELAASGGKLKSFVLLNMTDQLRYIYFRELTDCVSPLPESAEIPDAELYRRYIEARNPRASPHLGALRFKTPVWRAFTTPFVSGETERKLIQQGTNFELADMSTAPIDGKSYVVKKEDLAFHEDGSKCTISEAISKIATWAGNNGIDVADLRSYVINAPAEGEASSGANLQERFAKSLLALAKDDLARISIPADIVLKLIGR